MTMPGAPRCEPGHRPGRWMWSPSEPVGTVDLSPLRRSAATAFDGRCAVGRCQEPAFIMHPSDLTREALLRIAFPSAGTVDAAPPEGCTVEGAVLRGRSSRHLQGQSAVAGVVATLRPGGRVNPHPTARRHLPAGSNRAHADSAWFPAHPTAASDHVHPTGRSAFVWAVIVALPPPPRGWRARPKPPPGRPP